MAASTWTLLSLAAVLNGCGHAHQTTQFAPLADAGLRAATVVLLTPEGSIGCTGVVAVESDLVLTAAHCIEEPSGLGDEMRMRLSDGEDVTGSVIALDRPRDVGILRLAAASRIAPLPLADASNIEPGDPVMFLGRPLEGRQVQQARVTRRAPCPGLPAVRDAIFSNYDASPGDSGAAVVIPGGIAGLVKGGEGCRIAVPSSYFQRALDDL
jgi:S1-C subfamily serine protease